MLSQPDKQKLEIQRLYSEEKSGIASQTPPSREVPHRRTYEAINLSNLLQARIAANITAILLHSAGASHQSS
jgi:hypothetical protein